jgi:hypothetical protein
MNNNTFALPASTLCLPINVADFKLSETRQKRLDEEPVKEVHHVDNKELFLNASWSPTLLQLAIENLSSFAQIERIGSFENFLENPIPVNGSNVVPGSFLNNWTATQCFDHHIRSLEITAEELKQISAN